MTAWLSFPFAAAALASLLAVLALVRRRPSLATWCFAAGMALLALDSALAGLALRAASDAEALSWITRALLVKALLPLPWLAFSVAYSRGNAREFLERWKWPLAAAGLVPVGLALGFQHDLLRLVPPPPGLVAVDATPWFRVSPAGKALNAALILALAFVLMNLEQTFRSAVGTMRWRLKFVVIGLGVVFGTQIYVRSQAILFSAHDLALSEVEAVALLVGCLLLVVAYARTGLAEIDVYPSSAVLRSSLTVLILGVYLFIVGVLAELVRYLGGVESFRFQALVVLLAVVGMAVLLLSDRLRRAVHGFVARHFRKAQHDSTSIWTRFSQRLASVKDQAGLCAAAARLISETFDVLAVSIWLVDARRSQLSLAASTSGQASDPSPGSVTSSGAALASRASAASSTAPAVAAGLRARAAPFNLEPVAGEWADELRRLNPTQFPNGGDRWCVPLRAGDEVLGALVLADRVSGVPYTIEEQELLACIADQLSSALVGLRLADEVAQARELDAFRTMSAFFVHDLKNAAASLKLMLQNLPVHFDDPEFRQDALKAIGNTAWRIDELIVRLGALRQQPELRLTPLDLNQVVRDALDRLPEAPGVDTALDLQSLPPVPADDEQLQSVIANLVQNAREALEGVERPRIEVRTARQDGHVSVTVTDNGCGMSADFVERSLFRPFQSTKKKGLGIGMFQARMVVERHGGRIAVESEPGRGTTVRVELPIEGRR